LSLLAKTDELELVGINLAVGISSSCGFFAVVVIILLGRKFIYIL
jgi:hypothetical protein